MEKHKKYDIDKWNRIMNVTQSNYANMIKRLSRRYKVSNLVLIYYSIFLIIITLTSHYFPTYFHTGLGEYFGIILSIIVLAYSLVNNSANYAVRIADIQRGLNSIKTLKRELDENNIEEKKEKYYAVTDMTECREDVDFFITIKHMCKEYDINWITKKHKSERKKQEEKSEDNEEDTEKTIKNYLSEINIILEESKIIAEYIWYIVLFIAPIIIFLVCIVYNGRIL